MDSAHEPIWCPGRGRALRAALLASSLAAGLACPAEEAPSQGGRSGSSGTRPTASSTAADSAPNLFVELRQLLREDPVAAGRAEQLTPKVNALCTSAELRRTFLVQAQAQVEREGPETRRLAEDVVEHVASACFRSEAERGLALLAEAAKVVPSPTRWDVLRARLLAADGRHGEARPFAEAAMRGGSVHARALLANILAEEARAAGPGYRPGMFDSALEVVLAEPDGNWPLIDLTAVLSTRARLLSERAIYESSEDRKETLRLARTVYERLGQSPFPERVRGLALDSACVDAVELGETPFAACARGAEQHGHLGAAFLAGRGEDPALFDLARLQGIKALRLELQALGRKHFAIIVFRGDETELVGWIRPTAELIRTLARQKVPIVSYVRGSDPRVPVLARRAFELAEVEPTLELQFGSGVEALRCIESVIARTPPSPGCPLSKSDRSSLESLGTDGVRVLVGRDLDAELEDLSERKLRRVLLSLRQPAIDRPVGPHLKSLSDVFLLSHRAKELGGSMKSRPDAP